MEPTLDMDFWMYSLVSMIGVIRICGISLFIRSISASTPLATSTVFVPDCFRTPSLTPGLPLSMFSGKGVLSVRYER